MVQVLAKLGDFIEGIKGFLEEKNNYIKYE
jgi:hypothetical protein